MGRQIARFLLWLGGWKVDPVIPKEAHRCVMISAPHTTNWDAYLVKLASLVLGVQLRVAIKDRWTRGFRGSFVRWLGGIGVDRTPKSGSQRLSQTDAMAALFEKHDRLTLAIAPEGTRRKSDRWKMGFYYIAKMADVPIVFGYIDYKKKVAGIGREPLYVSDDIAKDMKIINDFYRAITPKYPENFSVDMRYE